MTYFYKFILFLFGWKLTTPFPYHCKRGVLIIAPHTSAWDFVLGIAVRGALKLTHVKFLGKAELFKPPFGFIFRWFGGTPVNRFSNHNVVDQVVERFEENKEFIIALSPEGTRKKVDKLRTGFYYIAKKAKVPIIMGFFDFAKKEYGFTEPFNTTDNEQEDFKKIISYFSEKKGFNAEKGLEHLMKDYL